MLERTNVTTTKQGMAHGLALPGDVDDVSVEGSPLVLLNACDSYLRRSEGQERVIGTLLGTVRGNVVVLKNSYAVPHNESDEQVAVDIDFHRTMFELNQRVNPDEVIVGWYSTGAGVTGSDALIQEFYKSECDNPVHVVVDTGLTNEEMAIRGYVSTELFLGGEQVGTEFHEVQVKTNLDDAERVGIDALKNTLTEKLTGEIEGLDVTVGKLQTLLDVAYKYVDDVVEGRVEGNKEVGRYLADSLSSIPHIDPEEFEALFNDSVQDVLLVSYLASLTRTQLALATTLTTTALPI